LDLKSEEEAPVVINRKPETQQKTVRFIESNPPHSYSAHKIRESDIDYFK
jgi:hypothetical protein